MSDSSSFLLDLGPETAPPLARVAEKTPARETGPLQLEALDKLLQRDIDAPRWLVPGIIPMAGVTYLAGQPKQGKSWLSLFLAMATASGDDLLGRPLDIDGPVLIVDAETSPAMLQERVRLAAAGHRVDIASLARIFVHHGRLFLDREEQLARLKAAVAEVKPALVILDPLAKLHGGLNENDASCMAWLGGAIRELTLIGGPAVVIVHHTVKVGDGRRGGTLLRGSSALWADADALMLVERDAGALSIIVDGRYCNGDLRLAARLDIDADHTIPTAKLEALDAPALSVARADKVLDVLKAAPQGLQQTAIRAQLGSANSAAVRRALAELEQQGLASMSRLYGKNVWKAT